MRGQPARRPDQWMWVIFQPAGVLASSIVSITTSLGPCGGARRAHALFAQDPGDVGAGLASRRSEFALDGAQRGRIALRRAVDVVVALAEHLAVGHHHRVGRHELARGFELSAGQRGHEGVDDLHRIVGGGREARLRGRCRSARCARVRRRPARGRTARTQSRQPTVARTREAARSNERTCVYR